MGGPAVIALLRHAHYRQPENVPSAMLPYPLTAQGEAQAAEAARLLLAEQQRLGLQFAPVIDSSRMLRAWQTADIIGHELHKATGQSFGIEEFDALAERSVGAAANLRVDEIEAIIAADPRFAAVPPDWKSSPEYRLPLQGAESLMEAGARVADHIRQVMHGCPPGSLKIIVGHGASLRHAAVHLGVLARNEVRGYSMYHAVPVFLTRRAGRWQQIGGQWKRRNRPEDSDEFSPQG